MNENKGRTVLGWTQDDVKQFNELLTKANLDQLKVFIVSGFLELRKRGVELKDLNDIVDIDREQVRGRTE